MSIKDFIRKIKGDKLANEEWVDLGSQMGDKWGFLRKFKEFNLESKSHFLTVLIVILVGTGSYGLGKLSGIQGRKAPLKIESEFEIFKNANTASSYTAKESANQSSVGQALSDGEVVASKNGTKYHFPWCSGAKQITEANKVIFKSISEAKAAGYSPASNCKGLK